MGKIMGKTLPKQVKAATFDPNNPTGFFGISDS
jgi:hypothetical protein